MQDYSILLGSTFENIQQIGAGGGGIVFKAHHKRLDIDVVLKKIHTDKLKNIGSRAELNILKSLKHPYIPQVFDFVESGQDVFTVMEFIPGESFAQLLEQNRKFRQKDVIKWAIQLCEVVVYLHSQTPPIIHCDIKPANIMLTPKGDICLIDFNISGVKTEEGIASVGYSDGYSPAEQFAVVVGRAMSGKTDTEMQNVAGSYGAAASNRMGSGLEGAEIRAGMAEPDEDATEICTDIADLMEPKSAQTAAPASSAVQKSPIRSMSDEKWDKARRAALFLGKNAVIDERTDIYGIGATLYHILSGVRPAPFYQTYVPVQKAAPSASESFACVIEKAMALNPSDRFKSSERLLKTVRNIAKIDRRYQRLVHKQIAVTIGLAAMAAASIVTASLGKSRMDTERRDTYDAYVSSMETFREAGDYERAGDEYRLAVELIPDAQDAYYEMAMSYFDQKEYEECIGFLEDEVFCNSALVQNASYGRFYYISGRCRLESGDDEGAVRDYKEAVALQPEELSYYSDYVIALARSGQTEEAEDVLQQAVDRKVSGDVLSLLQGEIALAKGDYPTAERALQECIAISEDDYNLLRAYTKLDEVYEAAYQEAEQYERRIELLTDALKTLPEKEQITLIERLAQVYIDYGVLTGETAYDRKAIELFRLTEERGYATFQSRMNIAVLYEKDGEYEEAAEQLRTMEEIFPDNYQIYKRLSFLELEMQDEKENADREYHRFEEYYNHTKELYGAYGGTEDTEMLLLDQLYQDVKSNGWL